MAGHMHMLVEIPPKISVSAFWAIWNGKARWWSSTNMQIWNTSLQIGIFGRRATMSALWAWMMQRRGKYPRAREAWYYRVSKGTKTLRGESRFKGNQPESVLC